MIRVIKLIDNQCDRYLIDADCQTLGRQWDNEAEFIVVEKPAVEIEKSSTCEMFVKANGQLVDVIQVYDYKPIPITSLLTQYRKITIGFSFYNTDGYVKNSEPKDFYFLEAIKPETFTPTEPQGKDRLNYLLANGLTDLRWKEGGHNTLELVNADSEIVRELELSGFVQEQADLGETNPQSEKYVQNKSTKYLTNEGADGTSPYATEQFVKSHVPNIDFSAIEQRIEKVAESVPSKTSELENDGDGKSKFITDVDFGNKTINFANKNDLAVLNNAINERLLNYYLKSETYSREEINNIVSRINGLKKEIVEALPTQNIDENTIYLVPKTSGSGNDYYDEYLYINGSFEFIGSTKIDLADYVKKTDYATVNGDYGIVKIGSGGTGITVNKNGAMQIVSATDNEVAEENDSTYRCLQPRHISSIVKKGLSDSIVEWTEDEKTSARTLIDAVGSTDYAKESKAGVVRPRLETGFFMNNDTLYIYKAKDEEIDTKTQQYRPIVPANLDYAVMKALSDCKNIEWTNEQKLSARTLLGIPTPKATQLEYGSYSITFE